MLVHNLTLRVILTSHFNWVTSIATTSEDPNLVLSSSRDTSVVVWTLTHESSSDDQYGYACRALCGHSQFVSDVVILLYGKFALSGSWDRTLRLWEINSGKNTRRFVGHKKDLLSVEFSVDNCQIVSGSRDKTIKLWNALGEWKYTTAGVDCKVHTELVSCSRFSPSQSVHLIVSCGWDRLVKVWRLTDCKLRNDLVGHKYYLNTVCFTPD